MPARRSNGEGSYYQYKRTGRWCGQISINGRRETFYGDTKAEVVALAQDYAAKARRQPSGRTSSGALGAYLVRWLAMQAPTLEPGTQKTYRWAVNRVPDELARIPVVKLKRGHIQEVLSALALEMAPASVRVLRAVLRRALADACDLFGIIAINPADRLRLAKAPRSEAKSWDLEESQRFLAAADQHEWRALWWLVISTGLRNGEVRALRWEDTNLQSGAVQVRRKLSENARDVGVPKQHRIRTVVLEGPALDALCDWRRAQQGGYLFTNADGTPLTGSQLRAVFYALSDAAGVSHMRFHGLRHTAITLMLQAGVPLHVVSRVAGHSKPSITTDVYSHVLRGDIEQAAAVMSDTLTQPRRQSRNA